MIPSASLKRPRTILRGLFIILLVLPAAIAAGPACGEDSSDGSLLTRPLLAAISFYQRVISPQQGDVCAFQPTCSRFAQQALRKYGLIQGGLMTSDRLQRCHSCSGGGYRLTTTGRACDPIDDHALWGRPANDHIHPAHIDTSSQSGHSFPAGKTPAAAPGTPRPPRRSPFLAAALSSAIPGAGKVYAGRPADGLYSLLVTGSSTWVAVSYGRDEHWGRAGLFGAMGLFFYLGNIYGSAVEAQRCDRIRRESLPADEDTLGFESHYRIGLNHLRSQRWAPAREELDRAAAAAPTISLNRRVRLRLGQSYVSEGLPERGEIVLRNLLIRTRDHGMEGSSAEAQYWLGVSVLQQGQWVEAAGWFRSVRQSYPADVLSSGAGQLELAARQGYRLPRRSPGLARTMSLFLPGSGQAYAGRPWNGLLSLLLNATAGYLTVDAFRDDRHLDGSLLLTLVWSRFYLGGLHNAGRYAEQSNRQRIEKHLRPYRALIEPDYSR